MRIYFEVIGCKLNQAEVEDLARQALAVGHQMVQDPSQADWAIVNTCTVTHVAARKSRQAIRHLHRLNPALRIAVIGCFAEISPSEAARLEGVALVLPNARKESVLQEIASQSGEALPLGRTCGIGAPLPGGHTRALVKVQDGCDNACTYCIVSTARGPSRSRPPEEVLSEVQARLQEGYREVVLTGVNLGAYGRDMGTSPTGWSLARLVQALLDLPGDWRLRLSSIEPWDATPELVALWPHPKLCRHLHVPLQSGSDAILRRMGRGYRASDYLDLIRAVRARVPEIGLSTDVIVGFPGEGEAEFAETLAFVEQCAFSRLHVFRYSPRPGTPAAQMEGAVPPAIAQARSLKLAALGRALAERFHRQYLGREVKVLFETATKRSDTLIWDGLTDNYIRVEVACPRPLANEMHTVRIEAADASGLRGTLL